LILLLISRNSYIEKQSDTIRYDTIGVFNLDSKGECGQLDRQPIRHKWTGRIQEQVILIMKRSEMKKNLGLS